MAYCENKSKGPCHCQPQEGFFCVFDSDVALHQWRNSEIWDIPIGVPTMTQEEFLRQWGQNIEPQEVEDDQN